MKWVTLWVTAKLTRPTGVRINGYVLTVDRRFVSSQQLQAAQHAEEQPQSGRTNHSSTNESVFATGNSGMGSAKLFADALLEEECEGSTSKGVSRPVRTHTEENWTGEERMQDAVLRMLVDKYKPLRGPVVKSADEKLREKPPVVRSPPSSSCPPLSETEVEASSGSMATAYKPDWQMRAAEPLLPAVEGHRPWHTTFTPPSSARIKTGSFAPSSARRSAPVGPDGETVKQDISAARRNATAQRLGRARESTLDYRLGLSRRGTGEPRRPMPVGMKAWASLVEERIGRARMEGQFRTLKGRGKPLVREIAERNPFIEREEFLMNRIVQRNEAAPPWIESQAEVENAIQTFRMILRTTWTRRAILHLTASRPLSSLQTLTLAHARALRDTSWAEREASYHASALGEVNELVRRYNGVAPYAVRKPYFVREAELERAYWESGEGVLEGVRERLRKGEVGRLHGTTAGFGDEDERGGVGKGTEEEERKKQSIWEVVREWIASLRA